MEDPNYGSDSRPVKRASAASPAQRQRLHQPTALRSRPWSVPSASSMASTERAPAWKIAVALIASLVGCSLHLEQRSMPTMLRRGYNTAFFARHDRAYEAQAALHVAHALQHDLLQLTLASEHARVDAEGDAR